MSRYPISLDRPVGNSEDSHFGDLLPDGTAESPATGASQEMLRNRINRVLKTLSYREDLGRSGCRGWSVLLAFVRLGGRSCPLE